MRVLLHAGSLSERTKRAVSLGCPGGWGTRQGRGELRDKPTTGPQTGNNRKGQNGPGRGAGNGASNRPPTGQAGAAAELSG